MCDDVPARLVHQGSGNHERYPYPGLVRRALGARGIERKLHHESERPVVANQDDHRVGLLGVVEKPAVEAVRREPGLDEQAPELGIQRLDHLVAQNPLLDGIGTVEAVGVRRSGRQQRDRRLLQGRVHRREADGRHPWNVARAPLDPVDRRGDGCAAAIAPRADVGGRHLLDGAVLMIDHQRRHVVRAQHVKSILAGRGVLHDWFGSKMPPPSRHARPGGFGPVPSMTRQVSSGA